jgi:hypothetical protein
MPPWAINASASLGRGMAGISRGMWPKRRRRYHRRHEEWIWVLIILAVLYWVTIWLALEIVMVTLWLIVVIAGGLHALALLAARPLRRPPGNTTPPPQPPQKPTWPHSGHG